MTVMCVFGDEIMRINLGLHSDFRTLENSITSNYETLSECSSQSTSNLKRSKGWSYVAQSSGTNLVAVSFQEVLFHHCWQSWGISLQHFQIMHFCFLMSLSPVKPFLVWWFFFCHNMPAARSKTVEDVWFIILSSWMWIHCSWHLIQEKTA